MAPVYLWIFWVYLQDYRRFYYRNLKIFIFLHPSPLLPRLINRSTETNAFKKHFLRTGPCRRMEITNE